MELIPSSLTDYTLESYLIKISARSRMIYWLIIFFTSGCLLVLPFIYVDVSVQTRGYLQSAIERQKIYTPFNGRIIFSAIRNGSRVRKGDTLLIIDSETIKAQKRAIQSRIQENDLAMQDLEMLINIDHPEIMIDKTLFSTERFYVEYSSMIKTRDIQLQQYQSIKTEYDRNVILHNKDLIPDSEFEKSQFTYRTELENLNQVIIYQKTLWYADLMQRRIDAGSLQAELEHFDEELKNRVLTAPVAGEIIQSADIQNGTVIGLNQLVAEISPDGELMVTCFVAPGDIGLINTHQNVRIMVDALHYNEWGLLEATITEISDDMIIDSNSNGYFRVRCKPSQNYLSLRNGIKGELRKGMSLNARIVVTRRSLFNLLFDKADKWINPYIKKEV